MQIPRWEEGMGSTSKQWEEWALKALRSMSDAVIAADNKGAITLVNPAASNLLAKSPEELLDKPLRKTINLIDFQSRARTPLPTPRVFRDSLEPRIFDQAILEVDKDHEIPVEAVLSPVRGFRGSIAGAILVIRDRRKQVASDQFFVMSNKIEAIGSLAGSIARVFNNWIGVINAKASSICDNLTPKTHVYNEASDILDASDRAGTLASRLMSIANASNNNSIQDLEPVSLRRIVEETVAMVKPDFDKRGVDIIVKKAEDFPHVKAEGGQLSDCLMNLLLNSAEAMGAEGGRILVDSSAKLVDGEDYCVLRVRDNGGGMSPEVLGRAFEPFYTTKNPNHYTGLGLTIVQGCVRSWAGRVKIRSRAGQGTSVRLFLAKVNESDILHKDSGPAKALVADDHQGVREDVSGLLKDMGYQVVEAASGSEAIETIKKRSDTIDLFFVDVLMPGSDGKAVLEAILSNEPSAHVVMMSGFSRDFLRQYLKKGAWGYLQKPFDSEQLTSAINRTKAGKQGGRRAFSRK